MTVRFIFQTTTNHIVLMQCRKQKWNNSLLKWGDNSYKSEISGYLINLKQLSLTPKMLWHSGFLHEVRWHDQNEVDKKVVAKVPHPEADPIEAHCDYHPLDPHDYGNSRNLRSLEQRRHSNFGLLVIMNTDILLVNFFRFDFQQCFWNVNLWYKETIIQSVSNEENLKTERLALGKEH